MAAVLLRRDTVIHRLWNRVGARTGYFLFGEDSCIFFFFLTVWTICIWLGRSGFSNFNEKKVRNGIELARF